MRRWGVFPHAVARQVTGRGHVVREVDEHGDALDGYNYGGIRPLKVYRREHAADRFVARLTDRPEHRML